MTITYSPLPDIRRPSFWGKRFGLAGTGGSDEVRRKIFHEGVHWFLSLQERPNPVWLEEGLAEVFSTFKVVKGEASWGQAIDAHVQLLRYQSMLPLERVMATGRENLFGDDSMHTSTVYAESWAFVHFLLFGQQGVRRRALADYSEFSHTMKPDEAFRRAFEKTYREMDLLLEDYLRDGAYYTRHQPLATVAPPKVEVAERLDVEDALGRLALAARRWDLAASHARAAITAVPASPRGHEILGLSLKENGDTSGALAEFELAASRDTRDFQPFFELGLAAQNAAVGPFGDLGSMTPGEARRIANYYERAINLHPRFHSSYQNLAGVIGMAEAAGSADRAFLDQGRKLFPEDAMVRVGLALLAQRAGDRAGARELLATVLSDENAEPASARGYARRTEAMWDQQEISDQIDRLIGAQKFAEVVALIDERLARGVAPELRVQLVPLRQRMVAGVLSQRIQLAMESGRWADARRYLAELIASSAPEPLKIQARRSLEELDRKRLGLDGAKK